MLKYDVEAASEEEAVRILAQSDNPNRYFVEYSDCTPDFGGTPDEMDIEEIAP
jgi:hypothetical protein